MQNLNGLVYNLNDYNIFINFIKNVNWNDDNIYYRYMDYYNNDNDFLYFAIVYVVNFSDRNDNPVFLFHKNNQYMYIYILNSELQNTTRKYYLI